MKTETKVYSLESKKEERDKLNADIQAFLNRGGEVKKYDILKRSFNGGRAKSNYNNRRNYVEE